MPARRMGALVCGLALLALMACGRPTKEEIVATWRYTASNGEGIFLIVGDDVTLQAAGSPDKPK